MPKISVLMGVFNGEKYIVDQVRSIQNQSFGDWELLVRDDGSTDNTKTLIAELAKSDPRLKLIADDLGNLGFSRNYIELMRHATADYIMFSDQDDIWDKEKVGDLYRFLKEKEKLNPGLPLLAHCDSRVVTADLQVISNFLVGDRAKGTGLASLLLANSVQGANVMINRLLRNLAIDAEPRLPYDFHLGLIAEATGRRFFLSKPLTDYRQHENNAIGIAGKNDAKTVRAKRFSLICTPTMMMGLDSYGAVRETILSVRHEWKPEIAQILSRHAKFVEPGFSLKKLYILFTGGYRFFRTRDKLAFLLYSIGLL